MTSREIFKAKIEHRDAPRPGLTFSGERINDAVSCSTGIARGFTQKRWVEGNIEYYDDMWGNLWERMVGGCQGGEVCKPAISDWSELDKWTPPQIDVEKCISEGRKALDAYPDRFRMVGCPGWMFSSARYLRKLEIYMMDMALYPEELKRLHEKMSVVFETSIFIAGELKADAIFFCEDMGTQNGLLFSPEMWDEYFSKMYHRLFGMAHEKGLKVIMHSCGQNSAILERLLKAGVNCFQFDQPTVYDPVFLSGLLKKYNAGLWSPIDIQKIMPTGDYDIIEKGVDFMFKHYADCVIFKNYGDLPGIGVKPEWDMWAYEKICEKAGIRETASV